MEVLVETFDNEALAHFWAGILDDQGIRTLIKPMTTFPLPYHGPFVPHGVYVMEEDAERAQALIAGDES